MPLQEVLERSVGEVDRLSTELAQSRVTVSSMAARIDELQRCLELAQRKAAELELGHRQASGCSVLPTALKLGKVARMAAEAEQPTAAAVAAAAPALATAAREPAIPAAFVAGNGAAKEAAPAVEHESADSTGSAATVAEGAPAAELRAVSRMVAEAEQPEATAAPEAALRDRPTVGASPRASNGAASLPFTGATGAAAEQHQRAEPRRAELPPPRKVWRRPPSAGSGEAALPSHPPHPPEMVPHCKITMAARASALPGSARGARSDSADVS